MPERQDKIGKLFLNPPGGKYKTYRICWYEGGQTRGFSTGESEHAKALLALAAHAQQQAQPPAEGSPEKDPSRVRLVDAFNHYVAQKGARCPKYVRRGFRAVLSVWNEHPLPEDTPDPFVSELTPLKQKQIIARLRAKGTLGDGTILNYLSCGVWAPLGLYKDDGFLAWVPTLIKRKQWAAVIKRRTRCYTLEQVETLLNYAARRERWWRYMIWTLGTNARPNTILTLRQEQIDRTYAPGFVDLLPPGQVQNCKRRPKLPLCPTLAYWADQWREPGNIMMQGGEPLSESSFFVDMARKAGVGGFAYLLRHFLVSWHVAHVADTRQRRIWNGHAPSEDGGVEDGYVHLSPGYLAQPLASTELLFQTLAPGVTARSLLAPVPILEDQPALDVANVAFAWQRLLRTQIKTGT